MESVPVFPEPIFDGWHLHEGGGDGGKHMLTEGAFLELCRAWAVVRCEDGAFRLKRVEPKASQKEVLPN